MEQRKLIKLKNETREMNLTEVYEQFKNYIFKMAHGFHNYNEDIDDLIQIGNIGLIKAFNTYDIESGNMFMTYMSTVAINEILQYIRKKKKIKTEISFDNYITTDSDGHSLTLLEKLKDPICYEDTIIDNFENLRMKTVLEKLGPKKRELLKSFFFDEMTQDEISKKFNISQSYISRLLKESLRVFKKRYEWS